MTDGQATATKSGAPDPLIGRVIAGRFKVVSLIARGGMGKVYRAEQAPLGRVCAVKVLNPNYNGDADPEFHRRFFREASITSKITHPNSVTIFDYGKTDDDIYFMAMEYLEGQTLHMALREGGVMSEYRVARITSQICRALREAHKLGVIHRDLKPANIFLTSPNRSVSADASDELVAVSEEDEDFVKVLDFGLVKHLSERPEEQLTQTGLFMGSPKYMAPEQIQGGNVDARTDIYSLGIIMYEMLAGKVPFERATSVNILMAHVGEPPPPMRAVNPNLVCTPAFEELVMSCIAKDPNQRLPSMDAMLQAIRRIHNTGMTGQLPVVNMSGPYLPGASASFPALGAGASSGPVPALGTGSHVVSGSIPPVVANGRARGTDGGAARSTASGASRSGARSRSPLWIALGIVVAAALGGGLGMLAFRWSGAHSGARASRPHAASAPPPGAAATPVPIESAAPTAASTAPATVVASASSPADLPSSTLAVTTEPPGASVREDGKELCVATPCDLPIEVDGKDATKVHRLVFVHPGYRTETRFVKPSDGAVTVKLARAVSGARPAPTATAKPETTTPDGFKEAPY
jgi:serine/threonine-protein kinase